MPWQEMIISALMHCDASENSSDSLGVCVSGNLFPHLPPSAAADRFASTFFESKGMMSGRSVSRTSPPSKQNAMPAKPGPAPSSMPCFPFTAAREKSPLRECCMCTLLWSPAPAVCKQCNQPVQRDKLHDVLPCAIMRHVLTFSRYLARQMLASHTAKNPY